MANFQSLVLLSLASVKSEIISETPPKRKGELLLKQYIKSARG